MVNMSERGQNKICLSLRNVWTLCSGRCYSEYQYDCDGMVGPITPPLLITPPCSSIFFIPVFSSQPVNQWLTPSSTPCGPWAVDLT